MRSTEEINGQYDFDTQATFILNQSSEDFVVVAELFFSPLFHLFVGFYMFVPLWCLSSVALYHSVNYFFPKDWLTMLKRLYVRNFSRLHKQRGI